MIATDPLESSVTDHRQGTRTKRPARRKILGRWTGFALMVVITAVVLLPIYATLVLSTQPEPPSHESFTLANFARVFTQTLTLLWLQNSMVVALATVVVSVIVSAPAGYVLSRGRSKMVSGYSLILFFVQSLPTITMVIPLFILFVDLGLVDTFVGVVIIFVGGSIPVATWMMAAYFDTIPISLEEAAWIDGCSVFGSFLRVVLRNSLPGILSTAIFSFLLAWNEYLIVIVFLKTDTHFTLPVGLQSFIQQNQTDWPSVMAVSVVMMIPPILVFAPLNKYFSVGGVGGSLAGR